MESKKRSASSVLYSSLEATLSVPDSTHEVHDLSRSRSFLLQIILRRKTFSNRDYDVLLRFVIRRLAEFDGEVGGGGSEGEGDDDVGEILDHIAFERNPGLVRT